MTFDAADEMEKWDRLEALEAENKRLREALERIANPQDSEALHFKSRVARRALTPGETKPTSTTAESGDDA